MKYEAADYYGKHMSPKWTVAQVWAHVIKDLSKRKLRYITNNRDAFGGLPSHEELIRQADEAAFEWFVLSTAPADDHAQRS